MNQLEGVRVLPELRRHLHHYVVLIQLGEHRGHFALPERIVEGVVDPLSRKPKARRCATIKYQIGRQALVLLIAADIGQLG
jgi:hypothetical protein